MPHPSVMVIDDDHDARELLARLLRLNGFHVVAATDGAEALGLLAVTTARPALILLDLDMPVLDGFGFLHERARHAALRAVPVVVISAAAQLEERVRGLDVAALHAKPVRAARLVALLRDVLAASAAPRMATGTGSIDVVRTVTAPAAASPAASVSTETEASAAARDDSSTSQAPLRSATEPE